MFPEPDFSPDEDPLLNELRHRLEEPAPWDERFRRLTSAIAAVEDAIPGIEDDLDREELSLLTCADCQDVLDAYIGDELAGRDSQHIYPATWHHLATCPACRMTYEAMREAIMAPLPASPIPAPRPAVSVPAWTSRLRQNAGVSGFTWEFTFHPSYLRTFLAPPSLVVRSATRSTPSTSQLILYDTTSVGEGTVTVEVVASRADTPAETITLEVSVTPLLPLEFYALLVWGGHSYRTPLNEVGRTTIEEVPLAPLLAGTEPFEITFISGEDPAGPPTETV